ncbi:hypothetical protein SUGI_0166610 [Cryptomeria japonica]|nr:hypothetical protein SUGI_0166610 [Cryptomeria japonica]
MMTKSRLLDIYWREVVNIFVYTFNIVHIKGDTSKTPYEIWFGHTPTVIYFKIFASKCYIRRDDAIGKFDPRSDEGICLGYSTKRKEDKCFNKRLNRIIESINVKVDEHGGNQIRSYDYGLEDKFIKPKLVMQELVWNNEPVTPVTLENSTLTDEQQKESENQENSKTPRYVKLNHSED